MLRKKISGGALQYTLLICVTVLIFLGAFLTISKIHILIRSETDLNIEAVKNANLGFDFARQNELKENQLIELPVDSEIGSYLVLTKRHWGMFEILNVRSMIKNQEFTKIGLLGGKLANRPAIYLLDKKSPLVLVGDSQIVGDAYLPKGQVERGFISGYVNNNKDLVLGKKYLSSSSFPDLKNRELIDNLFNLSSENNFVHQDFLNENTLINSFKNDTKIFNKKETLHLNNVTYKGNIIITSDEEIVIESSCVLEDVILMAPRITFLDSFSGSVQAFAKEGIELAENCRLNYPSSLHVVNFNEKNDHEKSLEENDSDNSYLKIGSNSRVNGVVALLSNEEFEYGTIQMEIQNGAIIHGEVLCEGNIELNGSIVGSVYASGFISRRKGAKYQNHIFDSKINCDNLSNEYVGLMFEDAVPNVSKWLY